MSGFANDFFSLRITDWSSPLFKERGVGVGKKETLCKKKKEKPR